MKEAESNEHSSDASCIAHPSSFHDACYLPRSSHVTGNVLIHEMAYGAGGAFANFVFFFKGPSQAALTVNNCIFTDNRAIGGTGNTGGPFAGDGIGGGLDNERGATTTVTGSTFAGNRAIGDNGADGLGGGVANLLDATLTLSGCMLSGNQALGGAGASGANGGNGFGGGVSNDGQSTLTVTCSTITGNQAAGGAAGSGGNAGQGIGVGVYFATGGSVCLDQYTVSNIDGNTASTSNKDIFGVFAIC
jgi:hypothetical protein